MIFYLECPLRVLIGIGTLYICVGFGTKFDYSKMWGKTRDRFFIDYSVTLLFNYIAFKSYNGVL